MKPLTKHQRGEISGILAMGGSRATAALYVGCALSTLLEAEQSDPEFASELRQAEGRAEMLQVKNITDTACQRHDWRASAWMLERRFPERYLRGPRGRASLKQLTRVLRSFAELIVSEIDDPALRQRMLERLNDVIRQLKPRRGKEQS